jgi:hypothetical protein
MALTRSFEVPTDIGPVDRGAEARLSTSVPTLQTLPTVTRIGYLRPLGAFSTSQTVTPAPTTTTSGARLPRLPTNHGHHRLPPDRSLLRLGAAARTVALPCASSPLSSPPLEHNFGEVCPAFEAVFAAFPSPPNSPHLPSLLTVTTGRPAPVPLSRGARP